ncbi:MAG: single-stranded DNA-binding protein [Acutalibacteraceae bacterium]
MLNICAINGRLTAEPELKTTNNGVSVCSFAVAVERNREVNGERATDFINCVAWRGTAEFISKYFHKGTMIAINGSIQQRQYTDKNGNKRNAFEILVDNANFCGSKSESGNAADVQVDESNFDETEIDDGDLPF